MFYLLKGNDPAYRDRIVELLDDSMDPSAERHAVRIVGLPDQRIRVKKEALQPIDPDHNNDCPICLEPLCNKDPELSCGHYIHETCLVKLREQKRDVACPMCRDWAGHGGDFKLDMKTDSPMKVLQSYLATIYLERLKMQHMTKKNKKNEGQFVPTKKEEMAAAVFSYERVLKLQAIPEANTKTGVITVMEQEHKQFLKDWHASNGKPTHSKFHLFLSTAIASALPDESWEPEFRRILKTVAPGTDIWKMGAPHLIRCLKTDIDEP